MRGAAPRNVSSKLLLERKPDALSVDRQRERSTSQGDVGMELLETFERLLHRGLGIGEADGLIELIRFEQRLIDSHRPRRLTDSRTVAQFAGSNPHLPNRAHALGIQAGISALTAVSNTRHLEFRHRLALAALRGEDVAIRSLDSIATIRAVATVEQPVSIVIESVRAVFTQRTSDDLSKRCNDRLLDRNGAQYLAGVQSTDGFAKTILGNGSCPQARLPCRLGWCEG